ncbi:hypothetical protein H0H92_004023 [Tricholoma furcatifolium]|nr:hypothetical protein H0H92_004023 [Tricholoma furcatifolium]
MPAKILQHNDAFEAERNPLEEDIRMHDWLFNDGPYYEGLPAIEHEAANQVLCIRLGNSPLPPMSLGPVEYLQKIIDECIDPALAFHLVAEFEPGMWSPEHGYRRLGDYLAYIGKYELDFGSWTNLQMFLPKTRLPYTEPATPLLPLDALTNLRSLKWCGHRNQLVQSWLPLTPSIIQSLHSLDLTCELALEDCIRLLLHGKRLKQFSVDSIEANADQVLSDSLRSPMKYRTGEHERPYLEFLKITSSVDISPLLAPFFFPSVTIIDWVLSYPTRVRFLPEAVDWQRLDYVSIVCDFEEEDSVWIRKICKPNTQHTHISLVRYVDRSME